MKISEVSPVLSDKFSIFERWLTENGTKTRKLELCDYGNEVRGCHATSEIAEDENIIEVPLKCLITVEMGKETTVGQAIIEANLDLDAPKHIFLMLFMLIDMKNPNSFFKPYYDILPPTLSNMPIFWNSQELGYLQGSYLLEQIDERNRAIEADYRSICDVVPTFRSICSLDEFKWARMCVCSRNFGLVIHGLQTAALVPYADMLNHYRPRETKWQFDDSLQAFTVVSLQEIHSGDQVYDSYGRKCNHRFLLNYGFSVENNVESDGFCPNEVPILVEMRKSDPLFEAKSTYYRRDFMVPYRRIRVCVSENENTKLLLAMLRLIEADKEDVEILLSCVGSSMFRSIRDAHVAISLKNELRMCQSLVRICDEQLRKYPTTLEEDVDRLANGNVPLFSNERNALIQVTGEKEVLYFFRDLASTGMIGLKLREIGEFEGFINQVRQTKHVLIFHYCRATIGRLVNEEFRRGDYRTQQSNIDLSRPTVV
jgi:histone-lysine N-methyltransferase SETD3